MIAKFTPFGAHDTGKTTTLRVLTYLLYKHNVDLNNFVYFHRANSKDKGVIYASPTLLPHSSIFNNKGKNKSADWRISFSILVPLSKEEKSVRIAIATPSDIEEEIVKNWDFAYNNYNFKEQKFIKPDFFISPCSESRARDEEFAEQNWHIQNRNEVDLVYLFKLPMQEKFRKQLSEKQWGMDIEQLKIELEENGVFSAGKRASSVKKMTLQQKQDSIKMALLIREKIFELSNLL